MTLGHCISLCTTAPGRRRLRVLEPSDRSYRVLGDRAAGAQHTDSYTTLPLKGTAASGLSFHFSAVSSSSADAIGQHALVPGAVQALGTDATTSPFHGGLPAGPGSSQCRAGWGRAGWGAQESREAPTGQPCVGHPVLAQPVQRVVTPFAQRHEGEAEEDGASRCSQKASWRRWSLSFGRWQSASGEETWGGWGACRGACTGKGLET